MPYLDSASYDLPFQSGSDTSREAALQARSFIGVQGIRVLRWFEDRGARGGTQKECAEALSLGRPSVCARVHALEHAGALYKTRLTRARCAVYMTIAGLGYVSGTIRTCNVDPTGV